MFFTLHRKKIKTTRDCLCIACQTHLRKLILCEGSLEAAGNVVYSIRIAEHQKNIYIQFAGFMHMQNSNFNE